VDTPRQRWASLVEAHAVELSAYAKAHGVAPAAAERLTGRILRRYFQRTDSLPSEVERLVLFAAIHDEITGLPSGSQPDRRTKVRSRLRRPFVREYKATLGFGVRSVD